MIASSTLRLSEQRVEPKGVNLGTSVYSRLAPARCLTQKGSRLSLRLILVSRSEPELIKVFEFKSRGSKTSNKQQAPSVKRSLRSLRESLAPSGEDRRAFFFLNSRLASAIKKRGIERRGLGPTRRVESELIALIFDSFLAI
jgi:hypothetical protein